MKRALLLAGVAAVLAGPARAQMAVVCANCTQEMQETMRELARAAQVAKEIENGVAQLVQLKNTFAAVAQGNIAAIGAIGPELGAAGLSNPFSGETTGLMQALGGLAMEGGETAMLAKQLMQQNTLYLPSAGDFAAIALRSGANAVAAQQALAEQGMRVAEARLDALQKLRNRLDGSANNVAGAAQAGARYSAETAVGVTQVAQLQAADMMTRAQEKLAQARSAQQSRQDAEAALAGTQVAADALGVGRFARGPSADGSAQVAADDGSWSADPFSVSAAASASASVMPSATTIGGDGALATMQAQPWGSDATQIAQTVGINPNALAATCVIESGCRNVAGSGTIQGPFQMLPATESAAMRAALAANPTLAAYSGTDAAQAVAASQELKNNALALQNMGVADPTVLQARALYQWGAGAGPAVALASDSATMGSVLPQYSASQLAANGVSPSMTVGAWRSSVAAKLGAAAYQPALAASST